MTPPILHAGLLLRPFADTDADAFVAAARESAASVGPWLPWCTDDYAHPQALDWFASCRASREAGSAFEFGIFCQHSGVLLGGAGLNDIRPQHRLCNLGYWVRQSRQRQGIAGRVVQALAAHAFDPLGLQRVEIVVAVGNQPSEAVAVRAGAQREGIARNRLFLHGRVWSAHMFSLVPGDLAQP